MNEIDCLEKVKNTIPPSAEHPYALLYALWLSCPAIVIADELRRFQESVAREEYLSSKIIEKLQRGTL